jgi:hypothetical protein
MPKSLLGCSVQSLQVQRDLSWPLQHRQRVAGRAQLMAGYTFSTRMRFSPPLPASRQWYYMPVALRLEPAGGEVSGTEHREEAGRTPRMTFWRPVTAGEVRPLVTLSPASISTRSDDPGSEAGRIAEL